MFDSTTTTSFCLFAPLRQEQQCRKNVIHNASKKASLVELTSLSHRLKTGWTRNQRPKD